MGNFLVHKWTAHSRNKRSQRTDLHVCCWRRTWLWNTGKIPSILHYRWFCWWIRLQNSRRKRGTLCSRVLFDVWIAFLSYKWLISFAIFEHFQNIRIFAGVSVSKSGEVIPTGVGRSCNWTPDPQQPPADEFVSFGAYQRTLTLVCENGDPGIVQWTPDAETPDTVYYQVNLK